MNNLSLIYYIAVAEELNITRAASRLYITQQSLSEHIRKLEKQYNAVFFERTPRLSLTYQGERMLHYAKKVVEAEHDLIELLREDRIANRTRLTIGQTSSRVSVYLPKIFQNYHEIYPNVILSIYNGDHDFIDSQLRLGKIELYMGMTDSGSVHGNGEILYQDKLFFIISYDLLHQSIGAQASSFIEDHRHGIQMSQACRVPIAMPPRTSRLRPVFDTVLTQEAITPNTILETSEHEVLFEVCQAGLCGCFVSREQLYRKIKQNSLPSNVIYFPAIGVGNLSCVQIVYNEKTMSPYALAFLNCCRETVENTISHIDSYLMNPKNQRI